LGHTGRTHLEAEPDSTHEVMGALVRPLNAMCWAQLPEPVRRRMRKCRVEVATDLVEIPYHEQAQVGPDEIRRGAA